MFKLLFHVAEVAVSTTIANAACLIRFPYSDTCRDVPCKQTIAITVCDGSSSYQERVQSCIRWMSANLAGTSGLNFDFVDMINADDATSASSNEIFNHDLIIGANPVHIRDIVGHP
jgi:hypothetical protein